MVITLLDYMIWPLLFVSFIVSTLFVNINQDTLIIIIYGSVGLGFLVLGESVCILSGHFDLSVGAVAGFSAMAAGLIISPSYLGLVSSPILAVLIPPLIGGLIGSLNGIFISKLNINPFLQTLGFMIFFNGATLTLSTQTIIELPESYLSIGGTRAIAVGLLIAAFAIFAVVLKYTPFGQSIYSVGSDKQSALEVGVNVDRVIIVVYTISGALAGMAGLVLSGYTNVVSPNIANGLVFPAFAATVIGGIDLFGGRGKITGALGGILLLGLIRSSLNIYGVSASEINMVYGALLLAAIIIYNSQEEIRQLILSSNVNEEERSDGEVVSNV